jgi:pSer/pThr/pTyr-binding forkhead associated (FHA) protein
MSDNDIVLKDKIVSRYHAEIIIRKDEYILRDLGSRNGTMINNVLVQSKNLSPGDRITICKNTLSFDLKKEDIFSEDDTTKTTTIKPAKDILKDVMDEKAGDSPADIPQRRNILNAIYSLSKSILKKSDIRSIFDLIVDIIRQNIEAERIYILTKNQKSKSIQPLFISDIYTRIGKYLLDSSIVTEDQLQEALAMQKKKGGKLGETLVKLGHLSDDKLNSLLTKQSSKKNKLMLSSSVIKKVMGNLPAGS